MSSKNIRDIWVDNVKAIACILVALGHFFMSLNEAHIIEDNVFIDWFITTIYMFHVQLFFICSGYLYQKYSSVTTYKEWKNNIIKKFVALGVPYFTFSTITWMLKHLFSSVVNSKTDGFFHCLFISPLSPYWYLFILFIIFVISFTGKTQKSLIILFFASLLCQIYSLFGKAFHIYAIDKTFIVWIWFVLGMLIAEKYVPIAKWKYCLVLFALFIIGSVLVYRNVIVFTGVKFLLGLLACYSIICLNYSVSSNTEQNKYWERFTQYTMPVFLMHTIFAAPIRILLQKLGITNSFIHFFVGIIVTFIGPIIAMNVMEIIKPLDFLIYPTRYIKFNRTR
ncbi:acyltransferase family protein [Butyrivibrio sp. NC2007]|uniref:acyltransferase family protein n=1 Tax=Butyrivibrio sp. NC2007 TaxID=1280683 RepID=UPI0003B43C5C|nr:acyltransferase [Butyrivibrio sp. NC2007]